MRQHDIRSFPGSFGLRWSACALACGALLALGCGASEEATTSYHTRGLIQDISGSGPDLRVTIHHEAVPSFKDRDGKASPMSSMSMIFGLADAIQPSALSVGQKLELDFDVRFSKTPPLLISRLKQLPADTALVLTGE